MSDEPDISALAERFGTPLYVYDGGALLGRVDELRRLLHPRLEIFYSLKANPNISIAALLRSRGVRAEVSSLAELETALRAGVSPEDIIFLGPGKSGAELLAAVDVGCYAIICESLRELELIDEIAIRLGKVARVALRVNPSFTAKGSGLTMGGKPRQFGIDEAQLMSGEPLGKLFRRVRLMGVQIYLGTRILSETTVVENTVRILDLAPRVAAYNGFELEMADVGGGLGVAYFQGEQDLALDILCEKLNQVVAEFAAKHPDTRMIMELGRYLVAEAGSFVIRVQYAKMSYGVRFAVADGGTNHHMAAVGIGSFVRRNFPVRVLNTTHRGDAEPWTITGPLCTPNDTLVKDVLVPPLREGDLVMVERSGAYGPSASPVNFLSHGHPAEVLVLDGKAHLIRERDAPDDLLRKQRLIDFSAVG